MHTALVKCQQQAMLLYPSCIMGVFFLALVLGNIGASQTAGGIMGRVPFNNLTDRDFGDLMAPCAIFESNDLLA